MTSETPAEHPLDLICHYNVIRRDGAVVPFEPSLIAEAMRKAFLVVHATTNWRQRYWIPLHEQINAFFERIFSWERENQCFSFDLEWASAMHGARKKRSGGTGMPLGTSMGCGFFSAAKPNLRNAP